MISWFEKHNKLSWIITILIAIVIFYMSSKSHILGASGGFGFKATVYHFYVFFFLTVFLLLALVQGKLKNNNLIFLGIIIAIIYAILDEVHQIFVPGRTATVLDVLVDSIGVLLVGYLYLLLQLGKNDFKLFT